MTTNPYEFTFDAARQAFASMADALKTFQVPQPARDFVKRVAQDAAARAETIHAGTERATAAIETTVTEQVDETAKISRNIQQALLEDAQAFFTGVDKLASAQSLGEAFQVQSDIVRERIDVVMARTRATADYIGERFATSAKTAQENFSEVVSANKAA
ncbi:phasin family protein [Bradyrhizobium sp. LHD-71]|uniref:phasin family protein n=1 Tax=Bradyrhizobium sp. LHD-71 TaxID=3072141 RepID=UPI00280D62F3|nr:phasin family protein [Bradyrhizobium sp. LHD-71]MDQ8728607.1 phasin family protein [Bradyrhizobium sp. LHD-71]